VRKEGGLRLHSDLHDKAELYEFLGALEPSVAQAPFPLQLFLPACLASPPPWPLQAFFPLQECLVGSGVVCATRKPAVAIGAPLIVGCALTRRAVPPKRPETAAAKTSDFVEFVIEKTFQFVEPRTECTGR
jgi:hypothetical protein